MARDKIRTTPKVKAPTRAKPLHPPVVHRKSPPIVQTVATVTTIAPASIVAPQLSVLDRLSAKHAAMKKSTPATTLNHLPRGQRKAFFHSHFSRRLFTTSPSEQSQENSEDTPKKPKIPRNMADGDRIMKVFGNPLDEDPTEPMIRSILPGGIARATGIENPRIGAYVTIHLNQHKFNLENNNSSDFWGESHQKQYGTGDSTDIFRKNQQNKDIQNSNRPTIVPQNNVVHAEIIRITKHEVFLALPVESNLINIEDEVSKTLDVVPSFRVPVTVSKKNLLRSITHPDDLQDLVTTPLEEDTMITPLLGCVLNALGDPTEILVKSNLINSGNDTIASTGNPDDDATKINAALLHKHTVLMPYNNQVAKNVVKQRLRTLPAILNSDSKRAFGVEEGNKRMVDPAYINKSDYQQLLQTFDDTATYTKEIDAEEYEDGHYGSRDINDQINNGIYDQGFDIHKLMESVEHLPPHLKRAEITKRLQNRPKNYVEALQLPQIYQGSPSGQLITGIPQLDLMNPIRKGQRLLFTSTDSKDLSAFGQITLRNILLQSISSANINADADLSRKREKLSLNIDSSMLAGVNGDDDENLTQNASLSLQKFKGDMTIGIYCAIGKPNQHKDKIVKFLEPVLANSIIIHTNDHDTPYIHKQAIKQAIHMSNALRAQGKDVVVVLDDLAQHAISVAKLHEPFNIAAGAGISGIYHNVTSAHAQLLDQIGTFAVTPAHQQLMRQKRIHRGVSSNTNEQTEVSVDDSFDDGVYPVERDIIGSSTAICLYTRYPESSIPSIPQRHSEQVLDGLKSIVDRSVPFHPHLQGSGFWPPIEVQPLHPTLPNISPVVRSLMQHVNSKIIDSQHLFEYSKIQEGLGIPLDYDVEQVIEWKAKVQALLMQSPNNIYSYTEQYLLMFSAAQERLLAGVDLVDIPSYKRFLLKYVQQYPTLLNALTNIVHASTQLPLKGFKKKIGADRDFTDPAVLYDENGESRSLDDQKTAELLNKYKLQPFLNDGREISQIEDFICKYFFNLIDPHQLEATLENAPSALFKPRRVFNPITQQFDENIDTAAMLGDAAMLQLLIEKLQHKYFVNQPELQSRENKAIFESFFKHNTIGKFGLPVVLDELLQIVVDDCHEKFLQGQWMLDDAEYQHLPEVKHNEYGDLSGKMNHNGEELYTAPSLRRADGSLDPNATINIPSVQNISYRDTYKSGVYQGDEKTDEEIDQETYDAKFKVDDHIPVKPQSSVDAAFSFKPKENTPEKKGFFSGLFGQ